MICIQKIYLKNKNSPAYYAKSKEKWVGGKTPLGYMKDPKDKNHLIICDEEAKLLEVFLIWLLQEII